MRRDLALRILLPAVSFSLLLVVWLVLVRTALVPPYLLPDPADVARSLWAGIKSQRLFIDAGSTLLNAAAGYAIGSAAGIALGFALSESKTCERLLFPYVAAFNAIPKVALGPFLFIWLGVGSGSIIALAALVCFYPVFVSTFLGARSADRNYLDLLRACTATRWFVLRTVKLPAALPQIFTGLQLAVVFALMGAVVMEFVASSRGLGFAIQDSANTADLGANFAALVTLAVIGVSGALLVRSIGRRLVFWDKPAGDAE